MSSEVELPAIRVSQTTPELPSLRLSQTSPLVKPPSAPPLSERLKATAEARHTACKRSTPIFYGYAIDTWFFGVRHRNLHTVLKPLLLVFSIAVVYTPLLLHFSQQTNEDEMDDGSGEYANPLSMTARWCSTTRSVQSAFGFVVTAMSFLLVFRLNRAAVRHYEARGKLGLLVLSCREVALQANAALRARPLARDKLCAIAVGICPAFIAHINGRKAVNDTTLLSMIEGLFASEADVQLLLSARHRPLALIQMALDECHVAFEDAESGPVAAEQYSGLCEAIKGLGAAIGGCERIKNFPLPYVYVAHVRSFLLIVLCVIPFIYGCDWEWATIPFSLLIAFSLLGIEAASLECEQPFSSAPSKNHLEIERVAISVSREVESLLAMRDYGGGASDPPAAAGAPATAKQPVPGSASTGALPSIIRSPSKLARAQTLGATALKRGVQWSTRSNPDLAGTSTWRGPPPTY